MYAVITSAITTAATTTHDDDDDDNNNDHHNHHQSDQSRILSDSRNPTAFKQLDLVSQIPHFICVELIQGNDETDRCA